MIRLAAAVVILSVAHPAAGEAQFATVGAGVLVSRRAPEGVAELHAQTIERFASRGYLTLSWTKHSASPTVITAVERRVAGSARMRVNLGAGLLWLEGNDYRPYPIAVSTTVFPLLPRTALVVIGSTQPFQDFDWSVVAKIGITVWFRR